MKKSFFKTQKENLKKKTNFIYTKHTKVKKKGLFTLIGILVSKNSFFFSSNKN